MLILIPSAAFDFSNAEDFLINTETTGFLGEQDLFLQNSKHAVKRTRLSVCFIVIMSLSARELVVFDIRISDRNTQTKVKKAEGF